MPARRRIEPDTHGPVVRGREQRPPGAAVAAAIGGETVHAAGVGARDVEAGLPAMPDTLVGIASVVKPFTALAVMAARGARRAGGGRSPAARTIPGGMSRARARGVPTGSRP